MSNRRNQKSQNKLVKWFLPLHRWLYPAMTATRRAQLRKNLEKERNAITRFWRRIEDLPLAMPPNERFQVGPGGQRELLLVGGHKEEDYESDRRRLRLRLLYWASLFAPLIYLGWTVSSLILGGFALMVEFWQWGCQRQRLYGYPDWKPNRMLGWMIQLLILEAIYAAVCFGIFNYRSADYWAIVSFPFLIVGMWGTFRVLGYVIDLLDNLYKSIKGKLSKHNDGQSKTRNKS